MSGNSKSVRLKVSAEVARIVGKGASREVQAEAARGALPLSARDQVTALFFLRHGADAELKGHAQATLKGLPATVLVPVVKDPELHPRLLDFVARLRLDEATVMGPLLGNPAVAPETLLHVAGRGGPDVLPLLAGDGRRLLDAPDLLDAILSNPALPEGLRLRLQGDEEPADAVEEVVDEEGLSKYQLALEMGVSEKIKMALTGDKEWRSIFLKDSNKLVSAAVLKNPRITDGEVLAVAKNKSSSEELIRLITLNRDWVKNYEMQKALVLHPKTPLPKALRYMNVLVEKDLKGLAKSRGVAQVLVNNARRMLLAKDKNR